MNTFRSLLTYPLLSKVVLLAGVLELIVLVSVLVSAIVADSTVSLWQLLGPHWAWFSCGIIGALAVLIHESLPEGTIDRRRDIALVVGLGVVLQPILLVPYSLSALLLLAAALVRRKR